MNDAVEIQLDPDDSVAQNLFSKLQAASGKSLNLDVSELKSISAQVLQVLLSAQQTWVSNDLDFQIVGLSDAGREHITTLGLSPNHFDIGGTE